MGFNRKDLQDDDFNFDDDFSFEDDDKKSTGGDEFKFDDEPADIGLDDSKDSGFGFEDEDMPVIDEGASGAPQRSNRTFVFLAAAMIGLFLLGLAAVLFLALRPQPTTPIELTSTQVAILNATTVAQLALTQTQSVFDGQTQTAVALIPTNTATATPTERPPTITPTPTLDPTRLAEQAFLTQVKLDADATATGAAITPLPPTVGSDSVAQTATAIALLLGGSLGQGGGIDGTPPTQEILGTEVAFVPDIGGQPTVTPSALPDTGLFDDIGGGNMGVLALIAFGLVGLIVVSRAVRSSNKQ